MDESEIPIDIHTNKLLDWLISRRHVPRDWNKKVLVIREKINEAIKDMPADKNIAALLSGSYINYFHCQKIVEILKDTEADSKNLFGQYSSKRMKDWLEIIKLYEKDNVYLGEVASLLQKNVNYEIPGLKKQSARLINLRNDCDKKESSYEKLAEGIIKDFKTNCKTLGIEGIKIKEELIKKAVDFPKMCDEVANDIKSLKPAMTFYQDAVQFLLDSKKPTLEVLQFIIENGNTTVYQWKYKKVPSSIEAISLTCEEEDTAGDNDEIDFDINTDITVDEDIDWGISTVEEEEEEEKETVSENVDKKAEKTVARGEEANTILGHMDTRNALINNILELEAFLKVRIYEINSDVSGLGLSMLPDCLQKYDLKETEAMLQKTKKVVNSLTDPTSLHYLNIVTSQKYVDQLADKLKQKLRSYEKMLASKEAVKVQREEAIQEGEAIKPKVKCLIQKSKELQEQIEQDISKKYKGRPVNLIGGANLL